MKKFVVYNDVHLYGPHELPETHGMLTESHSAIYLGDNVDMNHVKKKKIGDALEALEIFKARYKERFVPGNHELDLVPGHRSYIDNGICFEHGDWLFWGEEKRAKYMEGKKVGAGWFSRMFITATLDSLRKIIGARYSDDFKFRAKWRAIEMDCHTIVVGHKHPKKMADFRHGGIRIIVLPRGRNEVEL